MKIFLLIALLCVITVSGFAQNYNNGPVITYGFGAGLDFSFFRMKKTNPDAKNGLGTDDGLVGFNADFKFNDYFSIRPGVYYMIKGGEIDIADNNSDLYYSTGNYKLHYVEIPLTFIGHLPRDNGGDLFLGAGPYYAKGRDGKITDYGSPDVPLTLKNNGDFKANDIGATIVFGYQDPNGFSVTGNVDMGLTNVLQNNEVKNGASSLKTTTIYISFGKSF